MNLSVRISDRIADHDFGFEMAAYEFPPAITTTTAIRSIGIGHVQQQRQRPALRPGVVRF
jgi:hypothetical protein